MGRPNIAVIEKFFKTFDFSKAPEIKVNDYFKVIDVKRFVDSHLACLQHNKGKSIFMPYYDRLNEIYHICNTKND